MKFSLVVLVLAAALVVEARELSWEKSGFGYQSPVNVGGFQSPPFRPPYRPPYRPPFRPPFQPAPEPEPPVGGAVDPYFPRPGCYFTEKQSCEPEAVGGACGDCAAPSVCRNITNYREVEHNVRPEYCFKPDLVCKKIEKECGPEGLKCHYKQQCVKTPECRRVPYLPYSGYFGYPAYRTECQDKYECKDIDTTVCRYVPVKVCVNRDPTKYAPGYHMGYKMTWVPGYVPGTACGSEVCEEGKHCAVCSVEECYDSFMEKSAAECGFDNKKLPQFCPAGHMCKELCPKVRKVIKEPFNVATCVGPSDPKYLSVAAYQRCGSGHCPPGYSCKSQKVQVCPGQGPVGGAVDPYRPPFHPYPVPEPPKPEPPVQPFPPPYRPWPAQDPSVVSGDVSTQPPQWPFMPFRGKVGPDFQFGPPFEPPKPVEEPPKAQNYFQQYYQMPVDLPVGGAQDVQPDPWFTGPQYFPQEPPPFVPPEPTATGGDVTTWIPPYTAPYKPVKVGPTKSSGGFKDFAGYKNGVQSTSGFEIPKDGQELVVRGKVITKGETSGNFTSTLTLNDPKLGMNRIDARGGSGPASISDTGLDFADTDCVVDAVTGVKVDCHVVASHVSGPEPANK